VETPAERWAKLKRDARFATLPMQAMPMLLAEHREVTVQCDGEVNVGSKSNPTVFRDRRSPHLTVGRKFLAYLSSTDGDWIHLTDGRRYVCSVPRARAVQMTDADEISLQIKEKQSQLKRTLKQVRAVDLGAAQRLTDLEANLQLAERQVAGQTAALVPAIAGEAGAAADVVDEVNGAELVLAGARARRGRSLADFQGEDLLDAPAQSDAGGDAGCGDLPAAGGLEVEELL
jgi:hypothetical protein